MEHAAKAIWNSLKHLSEQERPLDFLAALWPLVVGTRMAEHTQPVSWEKGCVVVAVSDIEWLKQLEKMGPDVRRQINKWWASAEVKEVSFTRGRTRSTQERRSSRSAGSEKSPGKKTGPAPKVEVILKDFEKSLGKIGDKDLRGLVARVAQKYPAPKK